MGRKDFWEKYFVTYDILNEAIPYQSLMDDLVRALEAHKGDLIFDAGSGTGNLCIRLKTCFTKPVGLDFSRRAIEIHLKKDPGADVFFGDLVNKLPFPDNHFDKVVSNNVLYTISKANRINVMQEFYRILKPNGKLVIANVHTGFNPMAILGDHLKKSLRINGRVKTAMDFCGKSYAIAKMFYYSYVLIRQDKIGKYAFMEENEQRDLLKQVGFASLAETIYTYSNQSVMDIGVKLA